MWDSGGTLGLFGPDRQPLYPSGGWGTQGLISVERIPGRGFGSIERGLSPNHRAKYIDTDGTTCPCDAKAVKFAARSLQLDHRSS